MDNWYQVLVEAEYERHDRQCANGEQCADKDGHVKRTYIPYAVKAKVEQMKVHHAAEIRKAKADALKDAAEALETVTVHWSNDGENTRAAWLRRRADQMEATT